MGRTSKKIEELQLKRLELLKDLEKIEERLRRLQTIESQRIAVNSPSVSVEDDANSS